MKAVIGYISYIGINIILIMHQSSILPIQILAFYIKFLPSKHEKCLEKFDSNSLNVKIRIFSEDLYLILTMKQRNISWENWMKLNKIQEFLIFNASVVNIGEDIITINNIISGKNYFDSRKHCI